jgi:hypothetical protein
MSKRPTRERKTTVNLYIKDFLFRSITSTEPPKNQYTYVLLDENIKNGIDREVNDLVSTEIFDKLKLTFDNCWYNDRKDIYEFQLVKIERL